MLGISRSTPYRRLSDLATPAAAQQRPDAQIAALPADIRTGPPTADHDLLVATRTPAP